MILVDTSIWIGHLRFGDPTLRGLLEDGLVLMHPFVLGEIACANLRNRNEVLDLLGRLAQAPAATDDEALHFIGSWRLMGRGIGYVDAHLLASVMLADGATLWTADRRLAGLARKLGRAWKRADEET